MPKSKSFEIPDNATQWSSEDIVDIKQNVGRLPYYLLPDLGLPNGKYHIKIIGFAQPIVDEVELLNG